MDFRERFKLPIRIESTPPGARVFVVEPSGAMSEVGCTPLDRLDYPLDTGVRLVLRLDGLPKEIDQETIFPSNGTRVGWFTPSAEIWNPVRCPSTKQESSVTSPPGVFWYFPGHSG